MAESQTKKLSASTIMVRVDPEIKQQANSIFNLLGLDMSCAINIFLRQAIMARGMPFPIKLTKNGMDTAIALAETELMQMYDSKTQTFQDINDSVKDAIDR